MAGPTGTMPDGWHMSVGKWNVDAQLAPGAFVGASALQIGGTTTLTTMVGPWIPLNSFTAQNAAYEISVQASPVAVGTVTANLRFVLYDATRSTVATSYIFSTGAPGVYAVNSAILQWLGTPLAPWGRFEFQKSNADLTPFTIYSASCLALKAGFSYQAVADQVITPNTWTTLTFATGIVDNVYTKNVGGGIVQLQNTGYYQLSGQAYFRSIPQGISVLCRVINSDSLTIAGNARNGQLGVVPGTLGSTTPSDNTVGFSQRVKQVNTTTGSALQFQVWHNSGGNLTVVGSTTFGGLITPTPATAGNPTWFTGGLL